MTIRDIAIAFGYEVDKKTESKAEESIQALKDTATKALGAIGIGFSIKPVDIDLFLKVLGKYLA